MRITSWARCTFAAYCACAVIIIGTIGSVAVAAQQKTGSKAPAPAAGKAATSAAKGAPAAPAGPPPQVFVTGLQVVGTGLGANGSELHAFNERPGITVALGVLVPAGSGIVEIDERGSRVDAFTDDKGQSLLEEGRFGPFPKLSEDRSAALVEVEVHGRPTSGASAITLQGAIGMTLASGSKATRVNNVKFEPSRTLKLGAATITVKGVTPSEDALEITLGLSRQVLTTISAVRFLDAKGQVIESRRTSTGSINDAAEVEFRVTGKELPASIEFDVWQNMRQIKQPFSLTTGLSFGVSRGAGDTSSATAPPAPPTPVPAKEAAPRSTVPTIAPGPNEGAASVEAVVSQMRTAASGGKGRDLLAVIYPDDRTTYGQALAMTMAFSIMGHVSNEKAAAKAQQEIDALFAKHKLAMPLNKEPAEIFKESDVTAFVNDALGYLKAQLKGQELMDALPVPKGKPQDVTLDGDSARARLDERDVTFARVNKKWFIRMTP